MQELCLEEAAGMVDDRTRRRFILYDMHVVFLFCLCRLSKWRKANLT